MKRLAPGCHVYTTIDCLRHGVRRVQVLSDRRPCGPVSVRINGRPIRLKAHDWWMSEAGAQVEMVRRIQNRLDELKSESDRLVALLQSVERSDD